MKFRDLIAYDEDEKPIWELSEKALALIVLGVWTLILNLLAIIYIRKSEYIYFWDNATYWDIAKRIAGGALMPNPFKAVYDSVGSMDYNYIAGLLPAAVIRIFGNSRLVYVLTLVNAYLVPSMLLIYLTAKKIGKTPLFTISVTMLICPAVTFMAFIGFADVGGVWGALLCFYLYFDRDNKPPALYKFALIGVILTALMLYRRWYAFFTVSFITAMLADAIINKRKIYPPFITIGVVGLIIILFFRNFLINILLRDYGNLYSSYKFSVSTDLKLIARYFGMVYIAVLAAMTVYIVIKRRDLRPVFMWIQIIVCAVMFVMLQTHGQQHLLLYIPSLIMLTIYLIRYIDREWMLIVICAVAAFDAANVYIPYQQPQNIQDIRLYSLIPSFSMLPRKQEGAYDILRLKRRLDEIIPAGDTLGVAASSFKLNEDILRNAEASLGVKPIRPDYIYPLPQVDSRDTDIDAYGRVNYVLVAFPAQTHLAENSQRLVTEAAASFEQWTDIATAYEEIYDFSETINGMEIKLYHRVRDIPDYNYRAFMNRINN